MSESDNNDPLIRPGLEKLLIDNKLISRAQADVALADQEMTGMSFEEVLLIRGWVDKETLYKLAPWLDITNPAAKSNTEVKEEAATTSTPAAKTAPAEQAPPQTPTEVPAQSQPQQSSYPENLKTYRQLMDKILGKQRSI